MRKGRLQWIVLLIIGYIFSAAHIALGVWSMLLPDWISNGSDEKRGLFEYCKGDACEAIEMPLDDMRATQPGLIVGAMFVNAITMIITTMILLCTINPRIYMSPRTGQITVCVASFFLWLSGMIHFISFLVFHENMGREVYLRDIIDLNKQFLLINQRSRLLFGPMYIVGWSACVCSFIASFIFIMAANVQKMPRFFLKNPTGYRVNFSTIN